MFEQERREYETCQSEIKKLNLEMRLVDVEHFYGGERVVIYYLAEDRIDFRDLVKTLATEFQTRIEMRQIGVRDEAKLLADYGDCGKPVCCNTHLSEMPPVSMKMAKLQRATLDPTKISGRCGRLKCCLRYEYDTYQDLQRELPPVGSDIITNSGRARVLAQEILAGQVLVEMEDGRRIVIDAADVLTVLKRERKPRPEQPAEIVATKNHDEPMSEIVPPDLAMLEDTVFRDRHRRRDEPSADEPTADAEDAPDFGGSGGRRTSGRVNCCRQIFLSTAFDRSTGVTFSAHKMCRYRIVFRLDLLPKTRRPSTIEVC